MTSMNGVAPAPKRRRAARYSSTDEGRSLVEELARCGQRDSDIALKLRVAESTLKKHHAGDLSRGRVDANTKVMETAFTMATSGKDTAMTIFWLKARCGWKETSVVQTQELPQIIVE